MTQSVIKRRHIFIKKAFQTRFILGILGLILLSSFSSAVLIYWMTGGDLQAQSQSAHINLATAWERLGLSILLGNSVAVLVVGTAAIISVLYSSHKIAGPLYRFETLCREVENGNLDAVSQLRESDQLQELAQAFGSMVTALANRRDQRFQQINAMKQQLSDLAVSIKNDHAAESEEIIILLSNILSELAKLDS